MGGRAVVGVLAVGLAAACQGSDSTSVEFGSGDTAASTAAADSATATTAGDGASSEASATAAAGPSTTLDKLGLETAEEQIRALIQKDWETWVQCSADPAACDPAARLAEVRTTTGAYYTDTVAQLRQWANQGMVVRQPDGLPDNNFVITESVAVAPEGTTATAVTCTGDGRARYQPPAGGGAPALVPGSDAQGYYRSENYLVRDGVAWKIDGFKILEESVLPEGKVLCQR